MTAVSRPAAYTSDSVFTPLSPLGSPSTPAHLLPDKVPSPTTTASPAAAAAPARNHRRTASPSRAQNAQSARPARPARPTALARPSQGYPFPVMLSRQNTQQSERPPPPRLPTEKTVAARAVQDDGWGTPAPSAAPSPLNSRNESAPDALAARLASAFSDSSASGSPSSEMSCSKRSSFSTQSSSAPSTPADDVAYSKQSPPAHIPTPPAEPVDFSSQHRRQKYAGCTPGAPPPAPLVKLEDAQVENAESVWDEIEAADEAEERTPPSLAPSPRPAKRNPLASGLFGFSMSETNTKKESGVGSKVEVD